MSNPDRPTLGEWLEHEPFTHAMSSGFFGFFAHAGITEALTEHNLYPAKVSGSSAGAFNAGLVASGLEPREVFHDLTHLKRGDFWDPALGKGLLQGKLFDRILREMMPATTFEEAEIPAVISVYDAYSHRTEVIDTGDMVLAMRASCAFPGLFQPVTIEGRPKRDGGIKDHAGLAGVGLSERVLHINLARNGSQRISRTDLVSIHMPDLPRITPFTLKRGVDAYREAKVQMKQALNVPVKSGQL